MVGGRLIEGGARIFRVAPPAEQLSRGEVVWIGVDGYLQLDTAQVGGLTWNGSGRAYITPPIVKNY